MGTQVNQVGIVSDALLRWRQLHVITVSSTKKHVVLIWNLDGEILKLSIEGGEKFLFCDCSRKRISHHKVCNMSCFLTFVCTGGTFPMLLKSSGSNTNGVHDPVRQSRRSVDGVLGNATDRQLWRGRTMDIEHPAPEPGSPYLSFLGLGIIRQWIQGKDIDESGKAIFRIL